MSNIDTGTKIRKDKRTILGTDQPMVIDVVYRHGQK